MASALDLLYAAATGGPRVAALPAPMAGIAEALAVQEQLVARSGKAIAGWKVSTDPSGAVMYGTIYADDCYPSGAAISAARHPLLGIEGEIAYRFTADLLVRTAPYSRAELEAILAPFPAIEIVDSRFADYKGTPVIDRLADRMSNGGMVIGEPDGPAAGFDEIHVVMTIDGATSVDQRGGHSRKDPFLPALDFILSQQTKRGFATGQFITTGTFTGLLFAKPGQKIGVQFETFGTVGVTIGE